MNTSQRRRREVVEGLIKICQTHGVTSIMLGPAVHDRVVHGVPAWWKRNEAAARADRINKAGLMAQLYYLLDVMGPRILPKWLEEQGSVLDGFVRGYSSSAEEREADVGRGNVDEDGCMFD